jgi:hypothetical protein
VSDKLEDIRARRSPKDLAAIEGAILAAGLPLSDWRLYRTCTHGHMGQWGYRKSDAAGRKRTRCRACDSARREKTARPVYVVRTRNLMATIGVRDRPTIGRALFNLQPKRTQG